MAITITSETALSTPNGKPRSRRMVGIGEIVALFANVPVRWLSGRWTSPRLVESAMVQFIEPGVQTVTAEAGRERVSLQFTVVTPSVRVEKIMDLTVPSPEYSAAQREVRRPPTSLAQAQRPPVPSNAIGAAMRLKFILTPRDVSFAALQFRERSCDAHHVWGYCETHRERLRNLLFHEAAEGWTQVGEDNLAMVDLAALHLVASAMTFPLSPGGFQWSIPNEYRIGQPTGPVLDGEDPVPLIGPPPGAFRFGALMPQAMRIDPNPRNTTAPFRGTITVTKGGQEVVGRYA